MTSRRAVYRDLFGRVPRAYQDPKEHELQIQFVAMMKWALRPDVLMWHTPNGELRDKRAAAKLKAMGVLPGVADLQFMWKDYLEDSEGSHTALRVLFLELKRRHVNHLTEEQAAFGLAVQCMGADFEVADSIDEALAIISTRGLLKPDVRITGLLGRPQP